MHTTCNLYLIVATSTCSLHPYVHTTSSSYNNYWWVEAKNASDHIDDHAKARTEACFICSSFIYCILYRRYHNYIYTVKLKIEINNLDIRLTSYTYPKLLIVLRFRMLGSFYGCRGTCIHKCTCHTC